MKIPSREYPRILSFGVVSLVSLFALEGAEPVGVMTRRLQFRYVLFERQYGSYQFSGENSVNVFPDQSMRVIWDHVTAYIQRLFMDSTNTEHRIRVYQVWVKLFPTLDITDTS